MKITLIALMLIAGSLVTSAQVTTYKKDGITYLQADDAPVFEIIQGVAKYYKVQLILKTPKERLMDKLSATLIFNRSLKFMMEIIKENTGIKYIIEDKKLLVGFPEKK